MTLSGYIIHKSSLTENAASSEILLADVMAMRKAVLKIKCWRLDEWSGSKGTEVRACKKLKDPRLGFIGQSQGED